MPYYVYAIHAESKLNDLCGSFADYQKAESCEKENQKLYHSQGNLLVTMIYAQNQAHAAHRIKQIRGERGLK